MGTGQERSHKIPHLLRIALETAGTHLSPSVMHIHKTKTEPLISPTKHLSLGQRSRTTALGGLWKCPMLTFLLDGLSVKKTTPGAWMQCILYPTEVELWIVKFLFYFFNYNVCFVEEMLKWPLLFPYPTHEKSMEKVWSLWNGDIIPELHNTDSAINSSADSLVSCRIKTFSIEEISTFRSKHFCKRKGHWWNFNHLPWTTITKSVTVTISCSSDH